MVSEDLPILLTWPKLNLMPVLPKSKIQGLFKSMRRSYDVVGLIDFDRFDVTQRVRSNCKPDLSRKDTSAV